MVTRAAPEADLFGIYVHYPQCVNACGYCDFPKLRRPRFPHRCYTEAVLRELDHRASDYRRSRLRSVYLGGGTPSLWPPAEISRVVRRARACFDLAEAGLEVTVEANPETIDAAVVEALLNAGVNRLSVGLQSLDDRALTALTRNHGALRAVQAVQGARAAGMHNLSCDLIFGYQGQTVAHHLEQLQQLCALDPCHVSTYELTLAESSPLWRGGHRPVDDDTAAEMMERGREVLERAGFEHYEVSSYARSGFRSLHNALVWAGGPYLGLGAWAHSLVRSLGSTAGVSTAETRWIRVANPGFVDYLGAVSSARSRGDPRTVRGAEIARCDGRRARHEVMMLGLRTTDGVDRRAYRRWFGSDSVADFPEQIGYLSRCGLVVVEPRRIAPTRRGIWFADAMALSLLDGRPRGAGTATGELLEDGR